jgi:hypothetical protein
MKIYERLYRGNIDKRLEMTFVYDMSNAPDDKFKSVFVKPNSYIAYTPNFVLTMKIIDKNNPGMFQSLFVPQKHFYAFRKLLVNTLKSISEDLYKLYPGIGSPEFNISEIELEQFKQSKLESSMGMAMIPGIWDGPNGEETQPGIIITIDTASSQPINVPLEDAISISELLSTFDPNAVSLQLHQMFMTNSL